MDVSDSILLNGTVILGFNDVAAAGSRTLMGVNQDQFTSQQFSLRCFADNVKNSTSDDGLLVIFNPTKSDSKISLAVINKDVPQDICHALANEFIDFIVQRNVTELILLCALPNVNSKTSYLKVTNFANQLHSQATDLQSKDAFFSCLIQFGLIASCHQHLIQVRRQLPFPRIENLSVSAILVEGRKVKKHSSPNDVDGSKQCIVNIHEYLKTELNLTMNLKTSLSIVYNGDDVGDDDVALMYT